jgi:MtrB/PioB family decaheme-associated outer membrane protein
MSHARTLKVLLLLGTAWPAMARGQDFELGVVPPPKPPPPIYTSAMELGFGYQNVDSFFFARYGGVPSKGAFAFANATVDRRPAWDSGSGAFWGGSVAFNGEEFRNASARYGVQGRWRVGAFYDAFTYFGSDSAKTVSDGVGTGQLSLPAGWFGAATSLLFQTQAAKPVALKVKWQTTGGDYVLTPREGYELRLHVDHRTRDGLKAQYLPFGQEMLFPVGVFFPQTVDYESNHAAASLSFADKRWQWRAVYELSTFRDALAAMIVPNPFGRSLGIPWPAGAFAGYPFASGQIGLPPDNSMHQGSLSGGVALTPAMRLTAKVAYTVQSQNEPLLPYTINPNLDVRTPPPRSRAEAEIRRAFANVTLAAHQGKAFDMTASYTYDDRDNRTPRALFSYVANDVQDQQQPAVPGVSRWIRYNLPHSFTFQQAKAEAGYRVTPRTRLSVAYTGDFRSRTYQEITTSAEHTLRAKVQTTFARGSVWVAQIFANRVGADYLDYAAWNASHTDNYLAAGPQNQSIEYALLRKFHLADRRRHETKGGATYDLGSHLTADVSGGFARDNYSRSQFGLQRADTLLADASLSYSLPKRLNASLFYAFERIRSGQRGYFLFNANENNPAQVWTTASRDAVHTAGARLDWQARATLKVTASYDLSRGITHIVTAATPFTALAVVTPLPDAHVTTHAASLKLDYALRDNLSLRGGYALERHASDDWRYRNSLTPVAQILGSGEVAPRYTAHVVWVSARTQF